MSFQLNLFGTTALADTQNDLFWGELEGEDGAPPVPPATPAAMALPQIDFHMVADRGLADTWKQRARDNALAIALLKEIEEADRNASSPEQIVLSRFIGFGAGELANNLFPSGSDSACPGWEEIGEAINASTTDVERAGLKRATQYAHFTPELIVHALWNKVLQMGFRGGSVLEPGCGTGLFIAARPERLEGRIAFTGIENDLITARIARRLYPNQWIRSEDFTTVKLANGYDLAIGNPPFSNRTVRGPEGLGRLGLSLHDFFIARSVEALRPGGIAIFVTSRHALDKTDSTARRTIAEMADLMGAVRLPAGAMRDDAGTDVVVDVLVLRKRMIGDMADDETWLEASALADSDQGNGPLLINRYFLDHPEQVLGRHGWTTTQFGPDYTCDAPADGRLDVMLPEALGRIGQDVRFPEPLDQRIVRPAGAGVLVGTAADGAYFVTKGVLQQICDGQAATVAIRKADDHLPAMADEDFLKTLSKPGITKAIKEEGILPRNTGKEMRRALMDHVGQGIWVHPAARFQVDVAALNATFAEALAPPSGADDDDGGLAHDDDIDPEDDVDAGARTGGLGTDDPAATGVELDEVTDTPPDLAADQEDDVPRGRAESLAPPSQTPEEFLRTHVEFVGFS